jgi:hypothetical protein
MHRNGVDIARRMNIARRSAPERISWVARRSAVSAS